MGDVIKNNRIKYVFGPYKTSLFFNFGPYINLLLSLGDLYLGLERTNENWNKFPASPPHGTSNYVLIIKYVNCVY